MGFSFLESLVQRPSLKPFRLNEVQSDDKRQDNVFLYSSSVVEFEQRYLGGE